MYALCLFKLYYYQQRRDSAVGRDDQRQRGIAVIVSSQNSVTKFYEFFIYIKSKVDNIWLQFIEINTVDRATFKFNTHNLDFYEGKKLKVLFTIKFS